MGSKPVPISSAKAHGVSVRAPGVQFRDSDRFGSRSAGDHLIVAAASHTLERVFVLHKAQTLFVSNSLAFTLACAGDNVDRHSLAYAAGALVDRENPPTLRRARLAPADSPSTT